MNYFIIQRIGYEYNDEVYSRSESNGGTPERVFSSEDEAKDVCDELNMSELSGCEIMQYGYGLDSIFVDTAKAAKVLGEEIPEDSWDYNLPKLTLSIYRKLAPYLKVKFFEVIKVEGE